MYAHTYKESDSGFQCLFCAYLFCVLIHNNAKYKTDRYKCNIYIKKEKQICRVNPKYINEM